MIKIEAPIVYSLVNASIICGLAGGFAFGVATMIAATIIGWWSKKK